ncbi:TonB-dependent receptor domain-containing protein [Algoriphagus sanaruensis]|uniref:TonB-dependent receptor n=1 Tax=Algoriphagus sanaruensis TaxID=1727163 RepID=A0A142ERX8_9BACT|nr:TonB-dependent receptor [Algoriphagus sanaruensis]AMQ57883.1 TonB-dependent receptor [Algoriphagus sanaruensis]
MKINHSRFSRIIIILVLTFYTLTTLRAQEKKSIQIIDQETETSISNTHYRYGSQKGISDELGKIYLTQEPEAWLFLSHVGFGTWSLNPEQVQLALASGKILHKELIYSLQPVSVISLKMQDDKDKSVLISEQERLHHDAGAVLSLDPAVSGIRKSGNFAFDPVLRGFKYDQLNVVINGLQSANAACPNRMDPPTSQVALNRIKNVEILKGPHALRYGIGLGGTINYVQESPNFSDQSGMYGRASTLYESNGSIWRNEGRIGFQGKKYDIGFLGSYSSGSDYVDGSGNTISGNFNRGTLGLYADLQPKKEDLIQFSINRNFARDVAFPSLGMDLRTDDTWMTSLKHSHAITGKSLINWTNSAFFTQVNHLMDNLLREPRMMDMSTPAKTTTYGLRTEGEWKFGLGKLFAGGDFKQEGAEGARSRTALMGPMAGKTFYDNVWQDAQIQKTGLFTNYLFPIGSSIISASARIEINQASAKSPSEQFVLIHPENQNTQFNPGISLGMQRDLGKAFNLEIWGARVQRSGSLLERYANFLAVGLDPWELVGNPQIKPETNYELDAVLGYTGENLALELTWFGAYLTDYITSEKTDFKPLLPTSPGVRQYINIDKAIKTGVEFNLKHQIGNLSQTLGMAYTYGQDLELAAPLPEIAPLDLRYSLRGYFLERKLQTGINLRHVLPQDRVSKAFGEGKTPGFTLLDIDASYPIGKLLLLKGGVQNLLNETYYEHLSRPIGMNKTPMYAPGRNLFLMVSFKFD